MCRVGVAKKKQFFLVDDELCFDEFVDWFDDDSSSSSQGVFEQICRNNGFFFFFFLVELILVSLSSKHIKKNNNKSSYIALCLSRLSRLSLSLSFSEKKCD